MSSARASGKRPTVVAIAASGGGLRAVSSIVRALPADFQASTVVVLHLSEGGRGLLSPILAAHTSLHVVEPAGGERLHSGWIYTAAPGRHLLVGTGRTLRVSDADQVHHSRPSADPLFESLAAHPRSAIATGLADYILPLEAIAPKLVELVTADAT